MAVLRRQVVWSVLGGMIVALTMWTPAVAQQTRPPAQAKPTVPVLTNANIGKPVPLHQRHTLTAEEWQHFVAHQYVAVATPTPYERWYATGGPHVVVIPDSTPQPYIPPSYPLAGAYYAPLYIPTPVYPVIYPGWNSQTFPHHAPPMHAPQRPPQPPPTVQAPPRSVSVPSVSVGLPAPRGR